jgi:hypothetical protein
MQPSGGFSSANAKPNRRRHELSCPMMIGFVLAIRRIPRLQPPSVSKIPARNPLAQSMDGLRGHATTLAISSTRPGLVTDRRHRRPSAAAGRGGELLGRDAVVAPAGAVAAGEAGQVPQPVIAGDVRRSSESPRGRPSRRREPLIALSTPLPRDTPQPNAPTADSTHDRQPA